MELNQVGVAVRDLAEGVAFLSRLGLRLVVLDRESLYARFEMPQGDATFSIWQEDQPQPGPAIVYFEVEDLDRRHAELTALGIAFDTPPITESWLWREARFSDPTGNRFCLFHGGKNRRFPPWRLPDVRP